MYTTTFYSKPVPGDLLIPLYSAGLTDIRGSEGEGAHQISP